MMWMSRTKQLLPICVITYISLLGVGFCSSTDDASIYGFFNSISLLSSFEKALASENATHRIFATNWNSSQSLYSLVNEAEKLRETVYQSGSKRKLLFTDADRLVSELVKEVLLGGDKSLMNGSQSIEIRNLNGSRQVSMPHHAAASMLSFLDTLDLPSRRISVLVDDANPGGVTLTDLIKAVSHSRRKIVSFRIIKAPFCKRSLIPFILTESDVLFVDSRGEIAKRMFNLAQQLGLGGLKNSVKWVLSKRTMDSLSLTCSFPPGIYYGLQTRVAMPLTNYIAMASKACQAQTRTRNDCIGRTEQPTAYQLWTNPNATTGSSWAKVAKQNRDIDDIIVNKHEMNPFWPRLRVSVVHNPPWTIVTKYRQISSSEDPCSLGGRLGIRFTSNSSELVCMYGFSIDIIKQLEARLQFVAITRLSKDGKYGSIDQSNGVTDGIVGELVRGDTDLSVELIEDKTRNHYIAYTTPYIITSLSLAYLQLYNYKEADIFLPFSIELWLCILGTIAFLVIVIWALERVSPYSQYQINKRSFEDAKAFGVDDSANYIIGTFFTGEIIDQKPRTMASRSTNIVVSFVSILVISAYSANLIKFLVVLDQEPLVTGLDDMKLLGDSSKLKVGIEGSSFLPNYLGSHSNERIRKLYQTRVVHYITFQESVKALKNRSVDIILYDYLSLVNAQSVDRDCSIKILQLSNAIMGIPISINNQSTWRGGLNAAAVDLTFSGIADKILKTWFSEQQCTHTNIFYSLDIKRMRTLFVWLSFGILCCVVCMAAFRLLQTIKRLLTDSQPKD